jgi:type IV pilus biogenesis protein CpaD/CtpE
MRVLLIAAIALLSACKAKENAPVTTDKKQKIVERINQIKAEMAERKKEIELMPVDDSVRFSKEQRDSMWTKVWEIAKPSSALKSELDSLQIVLKAY